MTEKTLPTATYVLATVHNQIMNLLRYNRTPSAIYLGYEEVAVLRLISQREFYVYCQDDLSKDNSFKLYNLPVFRVNESNHIKVTD